MAPYLSKKRKIGLLVALHLSKSRQEKGRKKYQRKRRFWVHPILQNRPKFGEFNHLYVELRQHPDRFFKFFRMEPEKFDFILSKVRERLTKCSIRPSICPEERLAAVIRFLSSGMSQKDVSAIYRIGASTFNGILPEVCEALWDTIGHDYVTVPSEPSEWKEIANGFYSCWNFPNCVGALDGKHVIIQAPPKSGSQYFNYKKSFSLILLALCDSNYCFTYVDVGAFGAEGDASVFNSSSLGKKITEGTLNFPEHSDLPGTNDKFPYVIVGDEAFPLLPNLMRPFPGRMTGLAHESKIFNYRLSRARRVIENSFGILAARWRILRKPIEANPDKVDLVIKACLALHNYLKKTDSSAVYCPSNFTDHENTDGTIQQWRKETDMTGFQSVQRMGSNRAKRMAENFRIKLREYFLSEAGSVPWQDEIVTK